jgi:threonine dehydrogenase-like Zn-dependent dehydrogenase
VRSSQKSLVVPVPEALDPALAVASRMAGVATTVLYVTEVRESPWTAVFGLGMVGNLAAQALQIRGCRVIGIDPNAARRELASQCGIRKVIGGSATDVQEQIRTLTGGRGVGIAVDAVGHSAVVQSALAVTADYGQLILLGSPRVPVQANLTEFLSDVHMRWITVRGALEWNLPAFTPGNAWGIPTLHPESLASKQEMIFHWLLDGQMTVAPLVSHRLPPQQIQKAYEGLLRQPEAYTGVVLDWR